MVTDFFYRYIHIRLNELAIQNQIGICTAYASDGKFWDFSTI